MSYGARTAATLGALLLCACGGSNNPSPSSRASQPAAHTATVRNDTADTVSVSTSPQPSPLVVPCASTGQLQLDGGGPWTIVVRRASGGVVGSVPAATPGFEIDVTASGVVVRAAGGNHGATFPTPSCTHSAAAAP